MRSRLILSFIFILAVFFSGCSNIPATPLSPGTSTPNVVVAPLQLATLTPRADQSPVKEFVGRVIDMDGVPIQDAQADSSAGSAISDQDGWFRFSGGGNPQWIKVSAPGFISRTRAAAPGVPVLFRLTPDDGKTIVIHFAGDTMFGRRLYDPNGDDFTADGLLPQNPTVEDHTRLLAAVKPLLENADFTVLNFESTLSEQVFLPKSNPRPVDFHPTTSSVYASHPNSVMALKQSGVDVVDVGNNHTYDMLEAGLTNTLSTLDQAGVLHFGAGTDEANAWAPALISSKGQTIAFVGCTTMRIPLNTPEPNDVPYVASDLLRKGGAAYCTEARLRSEIVKAKQQADAVVVMIHGGKDYDPAPTRKISYLTEIARQAGAALVINHHPHVIGGFSEKDRTLIAWTMGTFLADQTVWSSLESYMLAVYMREGQVIRAYVEPLALDGFLPHGLTDQMADDVIRDAAAREPGPFVMESGAMEIDLDRRALQNTYSQMIEEDSSSGTILSIPQAQWISGFQGSGKLRLGRDLLWVGSFENNEVDSASQVAPLWDLTMGEVQIGPDFAYEGNAGIRLSRGASNRTDVTTTSAHRVGVERSSNISITGMVRISNEASVLAQISWYSANTGPSFSKIVQPVQVQEYGTWQPFRLDMQVPPNAAGLGLFLKLQPPVQGTTTVDFDNLRIIQWAPPNAQFSPLYNFAWLTGSGEVTFAQQILPGAETWLHHTYMKK